MSGQPGYSFLDGADPDDSMDSPVAGGPGVEGQVPRKVEEGAHGKSAVTGGRAAPGRAASSSGAREASGLGTRDSDSDEDVVYDGRAALVRHA
jgi:hypothetical protein